MRRYAVVGKPVRHSHSPWLHRHFARRTQREITYAALCPATTFAACCDAFFAGGGSGLNITLPYKGEALAYAQHASAFAQKCGAANVLKREANGELRAYNTDGSGLLRDLQHRCGGVAGKTVLLLGAGGSARAAAHALAAAQPAHLWLHNRTYTRAQELAAACGGTAHGTPPAGAQIVINATSAGHADGITLPAEIFAAAELAYDLSYGAAAADFMQQAQRGGARHTADGSGMLAWQAAFSFAIWEGVLPGAQEVARLLRQPAAPR